MFCILQEIFLKTTPIGYISLPSETPTMLLAPLIKTNLATFLKTPEISLPGVQAILHRTSAVVTASQWGSHVLQESNEEGLNGK